MAITGVGKVSIVELAPDWKEGVLICKVLSVNSALSKPEATHSGGGEVEQLGAPLSEVGASLRTP